MPFVSTFLPGFGALTADSITVASTLTVAGQAKFADGTAGAPGIAFTSQPGTGLYRTTNNGGRLNLGTDSTGKFFCDGAFNQSTSLFVASGTAQVGALQTSGTITQTAASTVSSVPGTQAFTAVGQAITTPTRIVAITASAPLVLTSAPQVPNGTLDGQQCTIINVDSADAVTFSDEAIVAGSNLQLIGGATRVLGPLDSMHLVWITAVGDWIEVGTADVA